MAVVGPDDGCWGQPPVVFGFCALDRCYFKGLVAVGVGQVVNHEDAIPIGFLVAVLLFEEGSHLTRRREDGRRGRSIVVGDIDFAQFRRRNLCKGAKWNIPQTVLDCLRRVELRVSDVDQQTRDGDIIPGSLKGVARPVRTCQGSSLQGVYRIFCRKLIAAAGRGFL